MREPYTELGIAIIGRAILDWRLESECVAWKTDSPRLARLKRFFGGELAFLCLDQINLSPNALMDKQIEENEEKRYQHKLGLLTGEGVGYERRYDE